MWDLNKGVGGEVGLQRCLLEDFDELGSGIVNNLLFSRFFGSDGFILPLFVKAESLKNVWRKHLICEHCSMWSMLFCWTYLLSFVLGLSWLGLVIGTLHLNRNSLGSLCCVSGVVFCTVAAFLTYVFYLLIKSIKGLKLMFPICRWKHRESGNA